MAKSQAIPLRPFFQMGFLGFFVFLLYLPSLLWMWERWFARDSYYSHGIFIPFISAYLVWQKRQVLKKIEPQPSRWGMVLFFIGVTLDLLCGLFRVYFPSGFSLILVISGLLMHFYGKRMLKGLLFPIIFLAFMIPLPLVVITNLSFRLKMFATQIAVMTLNNIGLVCVQHGSAILMRHAYVVVEDVCSGLRSLITLMALGSLFAYVMKSSYPKRIILFLSTIPIAVLTNVLRIIFLASVSEIWGTAYATGPLHEASGLIVFLGAFCMLYVVKKVIE